MELERTSIERTVRKVVLESSVLISNPCGCKFKFDIFEHTSHQQHDKTVALMDTGFTVGLPKTGDPSRSTTKERLIIPRSAVQKELKQQAANHGFAFQQ